MKPSKVYIFKKKKREKALIEFSSWNVKFSIRISRGNGGS